MHETLYRRPLPSDAIAFSSPEGRELFAEALASGGLGGYFPLAEQFHTQSEDLGTRALALAPLASNLAMREPSSATHQAALARVRAAVCALAAFPHVVRAVGADLAEAVTILLLAVADRLAPARGELVSSIAEAADDATLAAEIEHVRAQLREVSIVGQRPWSHLSA